LGKREKGKPPQGIKGSLAPENDQKKGETSKRNLTAGREKSRTTVKRVHADGHFAEKTGEN